MNTALKPSLDKIVQRDNKLERVSLTEQRNMIYEKFRTNIRLLRAKKGLSGCEASEAIGLENGKRIINLEYGRGNPTLEEMLLISKYFNVAIDDLMNKEADIIFNHPPRPEPVAKA